MAFVTAGFPGKDDTVDIMLAIEAGGADIIELGVPYADPQADGPAIQRSNEVSSARVAVASSLRQYGGQLNAKTFCLEDRSQPRRQLQAMPSIRPRS